MAAAAADAVSPPAPVEEGKLTGPVLIVAGFVLAMANFMAVLDTTIVNVALPNVAGALGASPNEGTSVITFFAVAEAITIPLTGWLAQRFGSVKVFVISMAGFAIASALCGLAQSLPMLIAFRILQGLFAGPMMPLSQALLMQIVPSKHQTTALGFWTMTVIVAPIVGPLLGGSIADNIGWEWAFYINVPVAAFSVFAAWRILSPHETKTRKTPIDFLGLALLITWVSALQYVLDVGKEKDWFASGEVTTIMGVAIAAFAAFVIWELTDPHPIVDLKIFRNTGFSIATGVISLTFGLFFSTMVLVPLWLQTNMGYTATWAGNLTAFNGILGVVISPIVARLMGKYDARILAFIGLVGMALVMGARAMFTPQISFGGMVPVQLAQGAFMPLFFIPLMAIALGEIKQSEMAAASGLLTFARILAGAIAASIVTTSWENEATRMRAIVVGGMDNGGAAVDAMTANGMGHTQALTAVDAMIHNQAVMLATNQMFAVMAPAVLCASALLFFTRKPAGRAAPGGH
jgi:MFS transporter, DHA2 family, multidrug resistance protein